VAVKLRRAHAIGPLAQLDLERADNAQMVEAVIPNERFRELNLRDGETLLVRPRRVHVFVDQGGADQGFVDQGGGI
jgi:sulfate transport system ATP-binding protein